jgi:protein-tyrosine phosphatase
MPEELDNPLQKLYNDLQNFRGQLLILDVRSKPAFDAYHLYEAESVRPEQCFASDVEALAMQFPRKVSLRLERCRRYLVVICGEVELPEGELLTQMFLRAKCKEVRLCNGTSELFFRYPFLFEGLENTRRCRSNVGYPNEIIPGKLYLGDRFQAESESVFRDLKVTHVVNATEGVANKFESRGVLYLRVGVQDSEEAKISLHFNKAHNFIDRVLSHFYTEDVEERTVVFVHCAQGVSRSATIVLMYLMRKYDWDFDFALKYLKSQRTVVKPNPGFSRQLRSFGQQKTLFQGSMTMRPKQSLSSQH